MTPVSTTELRQNLAHWLDHAVDSRAPILVTRQKGEAVVMVALSEWEAWMETVHLLSSPRNAEILRASIADANAGHLEEHDLIDPGPEAEA